MQIMKSIEQLKKEISDAEFAFKSAEKELFNNWQEMKKFAQECYNLGVLDEKALNEILDIKSDEILKDNMSSVIKISEIFKEIDSNIKERIEEIEKNISSIQI